jgi:hypothetical protein
VQAIHLGGKANSRTMERRGKEGKTEKFRCVSSGYHSGAAAV